MLCAFIVMKCEGFVYITDLMDYLENKRLIAYYCGFDIMKPLPSCWIFHRFLRKLDNGELKQIMAQQVQKLYKLGILDASLLDWTPRLLPQTPNKTIRNPLLKTSFLKKNIPKATLIVR